MLRPVALEPEPASSLDGNRESEQFTFNQSQSHISKLSKSDFLVNQQLFQPKTERRQWKQGYMNTTQYAAKNTASIRTVIRFILEGRKALNLTIGLTVTYLLLVFTRLSFAESLTEAESFFAIAEIAILGCFIVEAAFLHSRWHLFDLLLLSLTLALTFYSAFSSSRVVEFLKFFLILRVFRLSQTGRKSRKLRNKGNAQTAHSTYNIDYASRRVLDLLNSLLRDSSIQRDSDLMEEILWSIDVISSNSLYDAVLAGHDMQNQFKDADLLNLVQVFSAVSKPKSESISEGRKRANSMTDSIPIKELSSGLSEQVIDCLLKVDSNEFNVFTLKTLTERNELRTLMHIFFSRMELFMSTGIVVSLFSNFIDRIQLGYNRDLPYHTASHAADVVQALHYFLGRCGAGDWLDLSPVELAGCYLAACIHDFEHPGVNNTYLINTQAELAIRYNDRSVLENHHVSSALALTMNEQFDLLAGMSQDDFQHIRALIIEMVLATDVAQHFQFIAKFQARVRGEGDVKAEDKMLALSVLIHAGDISNVSRPWEICQKWTNLLMQEFWQQGDRERDQKLPIGYLMDRYSINVAKSQIGFIEVIVDPLFKTIREALPGFGISCKNLVLNKEKWEGNLELSENELTARKQELVTSR